MIEYKDLLGVKFTVHGRSLEEGFDCYGLAIEVLKRNGIILKDVFYESTTEDEIINNAFSCNVSTKLDNLEENCIILLSVKGQPTHIAVYIGEGLMIHATREYGVVIEPVHRWNKRIMGLYKVSNN